MATSTFTSLSLLFHVLFFSFTALPSSAYDSNPTKVSLDLYYESLCPYSANFIVNHLAKIFENGLITIVDLKLFPWGNAKIGPNNTFTCQHGPAECLLNTVEACAIHAWPNLSEHFPFINCVESLVYEHKYPQWESCFDKLELEPKSVTECMSSGYGDQLELEYAAVTAALQPPHEYVPWVVVDGQPLYEDYENFESYICKAYKGTEVPKACSKLNFVNAQRRRASLIHPVCYKKETISVAFATWLRSTVTWWLNEQTRNLHSKWQWFADL